MYFMPFGFDTSFLMLMPALILAMYAQYKVKNTFNNYSKIRNRRGYTGKDVAERILRNEGLYDIRIERVSGNLTDHYSSKDKVLRLSDTVYNSMSIAALGVAAHECGHAIQHSRNYIFLTARNLIVPAVNFGSKMAMPLILAGFLFGRIGASLDISYTIIQIGILLFSLVVLFQLITLPVELNASKRAVKVLVAEGYLDDDEIIPARKVLNAAALTYVASAAVALANLLRLIAIFGRRER